MTVLPISAAVEVWVELAVVCVFGNEALTLYPPAVDGNG